MSDEPAFDVQLLTAGQARAVDGMTYPVYRHLLALKPAPRHPEQGDSRLVQPVAMVAWHEGVPRGLVLAEMPPTGPVEGDSAELLSLYVHPALRGLGMAKALVSNICEMLQQRGLWRVTAVYMTGKPATAALEHILAGCGFEPPVTRTVTLRFTPQEALQTPWFARFSLAESDYEIFDWKDLGAEERTELEASNARSRWITPGLEFWNHDRHGFDPLSSLGLRHHGKVVGWVLNHRVAEDAVRFTCSFMRKDLGRRGRIMPLYTASIERLRAAGIETCLFVTPVVHRTMVEFVRRRCAPWASFFGETRGTFKELRTPAQAAASKPPAKANGSPAAS